MTSNYPLKENLLEALECAEQMALVTVFDDNKLREMLFEMGALYKKVLDGEEVPAQKVKKLITKFEKHDPEMLKLIKDKRNDTTEKTIERDVQGGTGDELQITSTLGS